MLQKLSQRFRSFFNPPWFIRTVTGQIDDWQDARGQANILAKKAFTISDEKVSVFKVNNSIEEAQTIAAYQLTRGQTPNTPVIAIRFFYEEINKSGLKIDNKNVGKTGVYSVDLAHRDLSGDLDGYVSLSEIILKKQQVGYDRVRRMGWCLCHFQFEAFLNDSSQISSDIKDRCEEFYSKLSLKYQNRQKEQP